MLGKRTILVDYSSDEGEEQTTNPLGKTTDNNRAERLQEEKRKAAAVNENERKKEKRVISYNKLGAPNILKSLLEDKDLRSKIEVEGLDGQRSDHRKRVIQFDTVSGQKAISIDEPRERIWKQGKSIGTMAREPYYYKAMKEIYHDKIVRAEAGEPEQAAGLEEHSKPIEEQQGDYMEIDGRRQKVKNVTQKELVNFDYAKYMEVKERKDLLLEDKIGVLKRGGEKEGNQAKLTTRAMELLEKDALAEVTGIKEEGIKRNKKQYGF